MSEITRRNVLTAGLAAGIATMTSDLLAAGAAPVSAAPSFRFAHATDMHLGTRNNAALGWATALQTIAKLDPAPEFLLVGGDCIGDALEKADRAAVDRQWDLYFDGLARHNKLPVRHVLGNHDVWAWMVKPFDEATPGYGKAMALERFGLDRLYYAFDAGGWHFVVLDNIARRGHGYYGAIDDAQAAWLKADLAANTKPVCVFSHIPLLSVAPFNSAGFVKEDHYRIPDTWLHANAMPLIELLRANRVKLCVSGHLHLVDRVEFLGVTFVCNGSVCGRWWGGPYAQFPEGFGVFDLRPDGSFDYRYETFGWDAAKHKTT
jgi:predicted MPP superfamily phosphohydrolase